MPPDRQSEGLETRQHGVRSWLSGELGEPPTGRTLALGKAPRPGREHCALLSPHAQLRPSPRNTARTPWEHALGQPLGAPAGPGTHSIHQHTRQV